MRRTSVLLEDATYEQLAQRARRRGTTVSEELREVLERALEDEPNPNAAWLEIAGIGSSEGAYPPVDSDEAKEEMAREIWRHRMGREPDW